MMMADIVEQAMGMLALTLEGIAGLVIAIGAAKALVAMAQGLLFDPTGMWKRLVWLHFAAWIVLALEFALAADICHTAISPSWDDVGKLAVIAAVRTALNYFLKEDLRDLAVDPARAEK